ncbi:hypothetical protein CC79DRAFT_1367533 [Sarocladium strictum]
MFAILIPLSPEFDNSENRNKDGAMGTLPFIFIYSITKGIASAVAAKAIVAIVLSQITPLAIASVGWSLAEAVFYFFWLPETSDKSLEGTAALFGDEVVVSRPSAAFDKASAAHDEEIGSVHRAEQKA